MVRKVPRKKIDINKFSNFIKVSENFYEGAKNANKFEYYNAAGVLVIHAAIALADSVTIKYSGEKCSGDNHYEIIGLLNEKTPESRLKTNALNQFKKLIDHKNIVSYSGDIYTKQDIAKLFKYFERFSNWQQNN